MRGFCSVLAALVLVAPGIALAAHPKALSPRPVCRLPYVRTLVPAAKRHGKPKFVCRAPYPLPPGGF